MALKIACESPVQPVKVMLSSKREPDFLTRAGASFDSATKALAALMDKVVHYTAETDGDFDLDTDWYHNMAKEWKGKDDDSDSDDSTDAKSESNSESNTDADSDIGLPCEQAPSAELKSIGEAFTADNETRTDPDSLLDKPSNTAFPCIAHVPPVEKDVQIGSSVIARLSGENAQYDVIYGTVESLKPLRIKSTFGEDIAAHDLRWVALAKDDGWMAPKPTTEDPEKGLDWQEPGANVIFKLIKGGEWVSAKVAANNVPMKLNEGVVELLLEGVEGLTKVRVQEEVALLFTPHVDCRAEFSGLKPKRGGMFVEHMANAFICEEDTQAQRQRWAVKSRTDGQYPFRGVFVHPQVKQQGLQEFVNRCVETHAKAAKSGVRMAPEIIMVLGAPASGKTSIKMVPSEKVPKELRDTVLSLEHRQEVNNDNLTNCMPDFEKEYHEAFAYTEALENQEGAPDAAWALQWLVYLLYHHGPVRDSLCWDVIKTTVIDAEELPVFYTSVMAGNAIGRTTEILELAHSSTAPVPHTPLRFVGFWPYASAEIRHERQLKRHRDEVDQKYLQGGNVDSNIVDLNYHQYQGEKNITKMMSCLSRGQKPTDDDGVEECAHSTGISSDHFLMVDNNGNSQPSVLLDFSNVNDAKGMEATREKEASDAARAIVSIIKDIPEWQSLCHSLFTIASFFLRNDTILDEVAERAQNAETAPDDASKLLPLMAEVYEELFLQLHRDAPTTRSSSHQANAPSSLATLDAISDSVATSLQAKLGTLRKLCCAAVMKGIRDHGH